MVEVLEYMVVGREFERATEKFPYVVADEQLGERVAGEDRASREKAERKHHHHRALARRVVMMVVVRAAVERHEDQPPGIERGQRRRDGGGPERIERHRVRAHI